ncbi:MAG TPA: Sec-independent protein translocase protein TatB [Devosiaceae bacterium]|jgi:sec-independent protein translocase protein TatB
MLGVGWTEMLVIGVVALIVIGPKDLPIVMQRVGRFAGMIRRMGNDFQRELNKTTGLNEVRNLRDSITAPLRQTTEDIRREFNAMTTTGVQPTGIIKPKDPAAESVVDEIHQAAGMKPLPAADAAPQAIMTPVAKAPAKVAKAKPVPKSKVKVADLPAPAEQAKAQPVKAAKAPAKARASTEVSPAPIEAVPPAAKQPAARKAATKAAAPAVTPTATEKPKRVRKAPAAKADESTT